MTSAQELSLLLASLYAAPLEPEKWQVFLNHVCALTNTSSGYMVSILPDVGNATLAGGGLNFDPESLRLYNEHYGANDPYAEPMVTNPRIGVIQAEELVSRPDLFRTELYNEVLYKFDLEHMTLLSCGRAEDGGLFPMWRSRSQGPMDSDSIQLLQMLLPHLQTALHLRTKILACEASDRFSEAALDGMSIAAFLVTGKGRLQHMNRLAASYLRSGDVLLLQHGRLTTHYPDASARLELLIAGAVVSATVGAEAMPGGAVQLPCPSGRGPVSLTIIPVPEDNRCDGRDALALVLVSDSTRVPRSRATLMRQIYGLTPVEGRVADLLLEGIEGREAAEQLGTTLGTFRFHVKRVMAKTGTHRQIELVRLMLSLPGCPNLASFPIT
jgi:DNA-binding CsgD family transcriptional regulator